MGDDTDEILSEKSSVPETTGTIGFTDLQGASLAAAIGAETAVGAGEKLWVDKTKSRECRGFIAAFNFWRGHLCWGRW